MPGVVEVDEGSPISEYDVRGLDVAVKPLVAVPASQLGKGVESCMQERTARVAGTSRVPCRGECLPQGRTGHPRDSQPQTSIEVSVSAVAVQTLPFTRLVNACFVV
jgi:hypothetical protein